MMRSGSGRMSQGSSMAAAPTASGGRERGEAPLAQAFLIVCIACGACTPPKSSSTSPPTTPPTPSGQRTYTTSFSAADNPISENGNWVNGKANGIDWSDVETSPGLAYGTESGSGGYDDSTTVLKGTWGSDQSAEATVHSVNQNDNIYEEVELRLRTAIAPHRLTGYEINFRCSKSANAYTEIVRWDGPLGKFTYLSQQKGAAFGVADGDVVKATIVGQTITVYVNGAKVAQANDDTFNTGNPGIGFFVHGASGVNRDFGFTHFKASDIVQQ
jgi:hypothetical protein